MRHLLTLFIIVCFFTPFLNAQAPCTFSISGTVLDADTKEPLPYVAIKVKNSDKSSSTDLNGHFSIANLCSEDNTVIVSCIGYCDTVCTAHHKHGQRPHIYLKAKITTLNKVTIAVTKQELNGTKSIAQTRLEKNDLIFAANTSLADALSQIEGVSFTSNGSNVKLPIIHGLYGNRILIVNNGVKHGFQNWGTDHAPEINITNAHNITVLKGASGVRFGPEALGGAILIENNPLYLNEPFSLALGNSFQTNGKGLNSSLSVSEGWKNMSYNFGTSWTRIGDHTTPNYELSNSGKQELAANGGLRYRLKKVDAKIIYNYVQQHLGILRASMAESGRTLARAIDSDQPIFIRPFSYDIKEPNQELAHHFAKAKMSFWYTSDARISITAARQLNNRKEFDVRRNAQLPIIDLSLSTTDLQFEWKHPDWLRMDGLIGIQWFDQDNDNNPGTGTTAFIPNYNTTRYSLFITENFTHNKNTYELGVRLDNEYNNVRGRETSQKIFRDEYNFTNLTSSLGLIRRISDASTFRSNIGSAWRTPNMAELYSFGQHGFKSSFGLLRYQYNAQNQLTTSNVTPIKQSNIKAEKGYKWINEWEFSKNKTRFTATAFVNCIQNFIFSKPVGFIGTIRGPMPVFIFDQVDAFFAGADFTWKKALTQKLSGALGVSLLWSQNIDKKEPLINQPPLALNYTLRYQRKQIGAFKNLHLQLKPSYTFKQYQAPRSVHPQDLIDGKEIITSETKIFDFKPAPEGYFLLRLSCGVSLGKFQFSAEVQNALNNTYRDYLNDMRYFADEPGINVLFSIQYNIKTK